MRPTLSPCGGEPSTKPRQKFLGYQPCRDLRLFAPGALDKVSLLCGGDSSQDGTTKGD